MPHLFSPQEKEEEAVLPSLEVLDAQMRAISCQADVLREQEEDTREMMACLLKEFQVLLCLAAVVSRKEE